LSSTKKENKSRPARVGLRSLLALHRTLGISSAVFVILLSFTGILLQHSARLDLDSNFIKADFWLSWYNIDVPEISNYFTAGTSSVSLIDDTLFYNTGLIRDDVAALVGFVALNQYSVAASSERLFLLGEEAGLIETLESVHGIPTPITAIATIDQDLLLVQSGADITSVNLDSLETDVLSRSIDSIPWSSESSADELISEQIRIQYGNSLLSWERLVLDLHSGTVVGQWGVFLMDTMAIIFLVMAISGVWIWTRRRTK
jgi:hypothetical protein